MSKYLKTIPKGMRLTNNEKRKNAIVKRLEILDGYCPCVAGSEGKPEYACPCLKARTEQECCCGLYEKAPRKLSRSEKKLNEIKNKRFYI